MASSFHLLVAVGLGYLALVSQAVEKDSSDGDAVDGIMEEDELEGLYQVLDSLLDYPDWAQVHPKPCSDTPWPGVQCEVSDDQDPPVFHVTKLHIGPDIFSPPCKASAKLSKSLLKLPYLKTLSIFNCFLTYPVSLPPTVFSSFSTLEHIALVSNPALSGDIPASVGELTSLKVLCLTQNNLQGKMPLQLGSLIDLEQLDLSYNNVSGSIPHEVGRLGSLTILDLSWNSLEGQVPSSLSKLQNVQKMDLGNNKMVGTIPPELQNLKRLVLLDLSHNQLAGPLPETLSGMRELQYFLMDDNPLNSDFPLFVEGLKKLTTLSFSGCGLTGQMPKYLPELENLSSLSLDRNMLNGTVPSNLGTLPHLNQLNLSQNQLTGELLLPEDFIQRLGERLDVRGNPELCTGKDVFRARRIPGYLTMPACFDTETSRDNKTWQGENPEDTERLKPPVVPGNVTSRSTSLVERLFLPNLVACLLSLLLW